MAINNSNNSNNSNNNNNNHNNNFTKNEMMTMQQDAIRRVREMQRRANANLSNTFSPNYRNNNNYNNYNNNNRANQNQNNLHTQPQIPTDITKSIQSEQQNLISPKDDIFDVATNYTDFLQKLNLDKEKIMIIVLIIILLNEGGNEKMILALCYLLL